jgi:homoserine O-acetyltransferase/O-succinyltransferase
MNAAQSIALPNPFALWRGGSLRDARIAYETWGELNAGRDNAILLFTGLSPPAHAASSPGDPSEGWWERMLGPGLAIDTRRYFVICVNSLGSCFGSTGPASPAPEDGNPYRMRFPELAVEDIARSGYEVARALGIERLDTVIGPSLGGMIVLAFAALLPGRARRLISISGSAAASPFAIALRSVQREAVTSDPDWRGGNYAADAPPRAGMRVARKMGTITYRSPAEWLLRFARKEIDPAHRHPGPFSARFEVEGYLEAQAERFVRVFDPNCYLYLSRAMDRFDVGAHGDTVAAVLGRAQLQAALVVGVQTDMLFAIGEQRALAAALEAGGVKTQFAPLPSIEGHDAFLVDIPRFETEIRRFLTTT